MTKLFPPSPGLGGMLAFGVTGYCIQEVGVQRMLKCLLGNATHNF